MTVPIGSAPAVGFARVRDALARALPRSPFEFVQGLDVAGDRQLFANRATRPIPVEDDLRALHRLPSGVDVAVLAERLPWDSAFFGYNVARIDGIIPLTRDADQHDLGAPVAALMQTAIARNITYLFASVDIRDAATLEALGAFGFSVIETRVTYHRSLEDYAAAERYDVRVATAADVESLSATAHDTVNPHDRFHADPFIRRVDADRLMATWVEASILEGFADATIVPNIPQPKAFCTVRYHRDKWQDWGIHLSQPVFSAVGPECRGWYRKLISEIHYHLKNVGSQHVYLTTQEENVPVRRTWTKLGYEHAKTERILRRIVQST